MPRLTQRTDETSNACSLFQFCFPKMSPVGRDALLVWSVLDDWGGCFVSDAIPLSGNNRILPIHQLNSTQAFCPPVHQEANCESALEITQDSCLDYFCGPCTNRNLMFYFYHFYILYLDYLYHTFVENQHRFSRFRRLVLFGAAKEFNEFDVRFDCNTSKTQCVHTPHTHKQIN